ncbi:hypothetical protein CQA49_00895 [Helicobacter sp. MIT 00-7814]|uniref:hypothetical protein n=1 Tax=unclassified Helicobacter TaxID=2593540 RepID=UPI000E1FB3F2|nr:MULTISPECIES: hypothetical protein [unclassified Helicobacter]RDU55070.1 hypothetical protein CQA37_04485 [Helicobacter sp. MIT 99-10781]RDU56889.1 hypothetical protein CQA49_00895 [Helicobacter sp. MIT 00-7814]
MNLLKKLYAKALYWQIQAISFIFFNGEKDPAVRNQKILKFLNGSFEVFERTLIFFIGLFVGVHDSRIMFMIFLLIILLCIIVYIIKVRKEHFK